MRYLSGLFACLAVGALSQAPAVEPPDSARPSAPPEAQSAAATDSAAATQRAADDTHPASQPDAKAAAATSAGGDTKPGGSKAELTREQQALAARGYKIEDLSPNEQALLARGYKIEIHKGQRLFCRRESIIGSHFETKRCNTAEALGTERIDAQETTRVIQVNKPQASHP